MYPKKGARASASLLMLFSLLVVGRATLLVPLALADETDKTTKARANDAEKVYTPGGDVKPPKIIHYVEPEFSSSSKEAFVDGVVRIGVIVTKDGLPTEIKIISGLNSEEDRTAMEAVKEWRFKPGTKGEAPVNVRLTVEVAFHLM